MNRVDADGHKARMMGLDELMAMPNGCEGGFIGPICPDVEFQQVIRGGGYEADYNAQVQAAFAQQAQTTANTGNSAAQQQLAQQQKYDPSKSGPEDPTNPGHPLSQNSVVKKASDQAFMTTTNGAARGGLAEAGFSIEYSDGKISIANKVNSVNGDGTPNQLHIETDANTIAILHTHGNNALPTPSPGDRNPNAQVPDFVRSRSALYVTVPHSATGSPSLNQYIQLQ